MRIELPKRIIDLTIQRNTQLYIAINVYKNGIATCYRGTFSYSHLGNASMKTAPDHTLSRITSIVGNLWDDMGYKISHDYAMDQVKHIRDAIAADEGDVGQYFKSLDAAEYDAVRDKWTPPSGSKFRG